MTRTFDLVDEIAPHRAGFRLLKAEGMLARQGNGLQKRYGTIEEPAQRRKLDKELKQAYKGFKSLTHN